MFFDIACIGLQTTVAQCQMESLKLLCDVTKKQPEIVQTINPNLFGCCVDLMREPDSNIHEKALQFVSQAFSIE